LQYSRGKVLFGLSVSLDGFIADKNDDVSEVFAWFSSAWSRLYEVAGGPLGEGSAEITGHRSFNMIDGENGRIWPDGTAVPEQVIVLQSQARESVKRSSQYRAFS
jgi:hypothetical protein